VFRFAKIFAPRVTEMNNAEKGFGDLYVNYYETGRIRYIIIIILYDYREWYSAVVLSYHHNNNIPGI